MIEIAPGLYTDPRGKTRTIQHAWSSPEVLPAGLKKGRAVVGVPHRNILLVAEAASMPRRWLPLPLPSKPRWTGPGRIPAAPIFSNPPDGSRFVPPFADHPSHPQFLKLLKIAAARPAHTEAGRLTESGASEKRQGHFRGQDSADPKTNAHKAALDLRRLVAH